MQHRKKMVLDPFVLADQEHGSALPLKKPVCPRLVIGLFFFFKFKGQERGSGRSRGDTLLQMAKCSKGLCPWLHDFVHRGLVKMLLNKTIIACLLIFSVGGKLPVRACLQNPQAATRMPLTANMSTCRAEQKQSDSKGKAAK